jgi:predicted DsbA family dithiol-disulfide isomerase
VLNIATQPTLVVLDFWADLACPWCYIGSRRLALAIAHEPDGTVLTRWRSFQLQPGLPADDAPEALPEPLSEQAKERIRTIGRDVGIAFRPGALERASGTALAQRAVLLYAGQARQRAVAAALYAAHFERGLDIAALDTVAKVTAHAAGEPAAVVRQRLLAGEGETELASDLLEARLLGVTAAPTYVVAGRVAAQGAQEVEVLRALIAEGRVSAG